jgi:hypothetical protein
VRQQTDVFDKEIGSMVNTIRAEQIKKYKETKNQLLKAIKLGDQNNQP